jgi:p-aminobenzoyl-glutamate transporter AbgT
MIKVLTIFIIVYAVSVAFMTIVITASNGWNEDRKLATTVVFSPILNTLIFCVGMLYIVPSDIIKECIKQRKEKIKEQHKNDPRWNLMNNRNGRTKEKC